MAAHRVLWAERPTYPRSLAPVPQSVLSRSDQPVAARDDHEFIATILLPAALVVLLTDGSLFSVARKLETRRVDAVIDQILARRLRAPHAQGNVVLVRAPLVRVAFNPNADGRICAEHRQFR